MEDKIYQKYIATDLRTYKVKIFGIERYTGFKEYVIKFNMIIEYELEGEKFSYPKHVHELGNVGYGDSKIFSKITEEIMKTINYIEDWKVIDKI